MCLKTLHRKYTKAIAVIVLIDWYYCTFKKIIRIVLENNSDKKCPNGCFITSKVQFIFAVEIEFYTKNLFLHSVLYNKWNTQIFKHKNLYSLRQYTKTLTLIHFKWNSHTTTFLLHPSSYHSCVKSESESLVQNSVIFFHNDKFPHLFLPYNNSFSLKTSWYFWAL